LEWKYFPTPKILDPDFLLDKGEEAGPDADQNMGPDASGMVILLPVVANQTGDYGST
jgi:hypothetical protein